MRRLSQCLSRIVGNRVAESMLGDLLEERQRRAERTPLAAWCWFWRVAFFLLVVVLARRAWEVGRHCLIGGPSSGMRWRSDLWHACRGLWNHRGSTLAIVGILGLGIGSTSAMFALADPYVLRPLPYARPGELVAIEVTSDGVTRGAAIPTVDDWRARSDLFVGLSAIGASSVERLRLLDRTTFLFTQEVSPDLFHVLGVSAQTPPGWATAGIDRASVVLTERARDSLPAMAFQPGAWLATEDGGGLRVAAAMPEFLLPDPALARNVQGLRPMRPGGNVVEVTSWSTEGRPAHPSTGRLIARLRTGVTPAQVASVLAEPLPSGRRLAVTVRDLTDRMTAGNRPLALGAMAAAIFVLIICAGNAGNLLLARRTFRTPELATRVALGASRADLARLWVAELILVSTVSVVLGLLVASGLLSIIGRVIPTSYVVLGSPTLSLRVVVFSLAAGASTILLGLSLLLLQGLDVAAPMFGRTAGADGRPLRVFRQVSVGLQSAFAMILVVGAALLVQSYGHLVAQQTGFDDRTVAVTVMYPSTLREASAEAVLDASLDRLRRIPGVIAVAVADGNVVNGRLVTSVRLAFTVNGAPAEGQLRSVSEDYFAVTGMTFARGRGLTEADQDRPQIVVNEALASRYWPGGAAVGQITSVGTIVGVVKDAFEEAYDRQPVPTVYNLLRARIHGTGVLRGRFSSGLTYVLRTETDRSVHEAAVRKALFDVSPDGMVVELDTLGHKLGNTVRSRTFATLILSLFGATGAAVTIAGLVGIVAVTVARRTREIAIRMAIGAQRSQIRRLVTSDVLVAAGVGSTVGLLAGRWLSTWLESFAYGVRAGNWTTALLAGFLMLAATAGASLVPARRATRLQPAEALRRD